MKRNIFICTSIIILALIVVLQLRAAPSELNLLATANGPHIYARSKPQHVNAVVLAAATADTNAVPSGARFVFFAATGDFYARPDGAVAVPAANVTDGTGGELNPTLWAVHDVTNIAVIAPTATKVTMSYYK